MCYSRVFRPLSHSLLAATVLLALIGYGCQTSGPGTALRETPQEAERITNSLDMALVRIPSGTFVMGSPREETTHSESEDQKSVTIPKPFYMAVYPVTQAQWMQVMGTRPSRFVGENLPVERVSWDDANKFCEQLSRSEGRHYRLPTEAEWEYACRAGTKTIFYNGNTLADLARAAWFADNSGDHPLDSASLMAARADYFRILDENRCRTHPVGEKEPNRWGLYDMLGNVTVWCADRVPEPLPESAAAKVLESMYVLRGSSWYDDAARCRVASAGGTFRSIRNNGIGLRIVLDSRG